MGYLLDPANWEWVFAGRNFMFLVERFLNNIILALITMALSLILGLVIALLRISKNKVTSVVTGIWIDVWRNLPVLLILLYFGLALPQEAKEFWVDIAPGFLPPQIRSSGQVIASIVALTIYNSAVIAEIFRAGIQSLERGQGEAAAALGLPYWKAMRIVILPQGLRRMVPATVSQLITLTKDTSLVSILAIQELVAAGSIVNNTSGSPFGGVGVPAPILQVYVVVGGMFVVFNLALSLLSRRLEVRERKRAGDVETVTGLEDQITIKPV
ncbi:MAG: ABC transporter permease subunit [Actinobacteria bacterium]|nr:ABC transporter permease subunit [Actinomycetota bacterium]